MICEFYNLDNTSIHKKYSSTYLPGRIFSHLKDRDILNFVSPIATYDNTPKRVNLIVLRSQDQLRLGKTDISPTLWD